MIVVEFEDGTAVAFKNNEEWKASHLADKPHKEVLLATKYDPNAYFIRYKVTLNYDGDTPSLTTDKKVTPESDRRYMERNGYLNHGRMHLGISYGYSDVSWHDAIKQAVNAADACMT